MLGREFSGMTYPQVGVPDAHHPVTHHAMEPEKIAKVAKINACHVQLFACLARTSARAAGVVVVRVGSVRQMEAT
jgi:hypothetical protein